MSESNTGQNGQDFKVSTEETVAVEVPDFQAIEQARQVVAVVKEEDGGRLRGPKGRFISKDVVEELQETAAKPSWKETIDDPVESMRYREALKAKEQQDVARSVDTGSEGEQVDPVELLTEGMHIGDLRDLASKLEEGRIPGALRQKRDYSDSYDKHQEKQAAAVAKAINAIKVKTERMERAEEAARAKASAEVHREKIIDEMNRFRAKKEVDKFIANKEQAAERGAEARQKRLERTAKLEAEKEAAEQEVRAQEEAAEIEARAQEEAAKIEAAAKIRENQDRWGVKRKADAQESKPAEPVTTEDRLEYDAVLDGPYKDWYARSPRERLAHRPENPARYKLDKMIEELGISPDTTPDETAAELAPVKPAAWDEKDLKDIEAFASSLGVIDEKKKSAESDGLVRVPVGPHTSRVKVFTDEEAARKALELEGRGEEPLTPGEDGHYRVGRSIFPTEAAARRYLEESNAPQSVAPPRVTMMPPSPPVREESASIRMPEEIVLGRGPTFEPYPPAGSRELASSEGVTGAESGSWLGKRLQSVKELFKGKERTPEEAKKHKKRLLGMTAVALALTGSAIAYAASGNVGNSAETASSATPTTTTLTVEMGDVQLPGGQFDASTVKENTELKTFLREVNTDEEVENFNTMVKNPEDFARYQKRVSELQNQNPELSEAEINRIAEAELAAASGNA